MPINVTAVPDSSSSIIATLTPAIDASGVDHYIVQIKEDTEKTCNATPMALSCTISTLSPATLYTVQVMACLDESSDPNPCSPVKIGGQSWTRPTRNDFIGSRLHCLHSCLK